MIRASELKGNSRIAWLDGVRGVAIILVLISHYVVGNVHSVPGGALAYAIKALSLAWCGVDLFFVLSGLLIGGILIDRHRSAGFLQVFYLRRCCRILPVYLLWVLAFVVMQHLVLPSNPGTALLLGDPLPTWSYLLFVQNILMAQQGSFGPTWMGISWSLAVEEQFYLTIPFLFWMFPANKLIKPLIAAALMVPVLRIAIFNCQGGEGIAGYVLMPCRADALLLGVLCAFAIRNPALTEVAKRRIGWLYAALAVLAGVLASMVLRSLDYRGFEMISYGYSAIAMFFSLSIYTLAVRPPRRLIHLLEAAWLRKLGCVSYAVYLFHEACNGGLHALIFRDTPRVDGFATLLVSLSALLLTLSLAACSWVLLERRMIDYGRSKSYRSSSEAGDVR